VENWPDILMAQPVSRSSGPSDRTEGGTSHSRFRDPWFFGSQRNCSLENFDGKGNANRYAASETRAKTFSSIVLFPFSSLFLFFVVFNNFWLLGLLDQNIKI
jgi:hypothetical protein